MSPIRPGTHIDSDDAFTRWLMIFESAMDVYDHAVKERERGLALCGSEFFQEIYRKRGCPPYYRFYDFSPFQDRLIHVTTDSAGRPQILTTIEHLAELEHSCKSARGKNRQKREDRYFEEVLLMRCVAVDRYCTLTYRASVVELVRQARNYKKPEALLALVALDASFLTAPFVQRAIRQAEIENDLAFKRQLAKELLIDQRTPDGRYYTIRPVSPKQVDLKCGARDPRRNRYALSLALVAGLDGETEHQIAEFFRKYNRLIGGTIQRDSSDAFYSFESKGAIHQALRTFGLKKRPGRIGRPKGQSLGSTDLSDK